MLDSASTGTFVLPADAETHLFVCPRSFKQLIRGLDDDNNVQPDSDEVRAE